METHKIAVYAVLDMPCQVPRKILRYVGDGFSVGTIAIQ